MYEARLFVCFVLYLWDPLNQDASDHILGLFGKLSRRGALAWFHEVWTCCAKVLEYWMIFSLKSKLNHSRKCRSNWNVPLVLLEISWWSGFNGIYLVRFGFRVFWPCLSFFLSASSAATYIYIYFHCSYLYNCYNYLPRTLCIKCWVSAFRTQTSVLCGPQSKRE
jgi:hypothetical protein